MITKLKLTNFKIFKEEEFELAPLTLISGINGMGKSSLIQSLLLLKQSYEIGYLEGRKAVDLDNDFIDLESAEDLLYAGVIEKNARQVGINITINDSETHNWEIDASNPSAKILDVSYTGEGNLSSLALFQEDFTFLDAERWGPRKVYYKKEKRAYNTKLGIQGELAPAYIANALTNFETLGIALLKHPTVATTELFDNLNAWISDIMSVPFRTKIAELDNSSLKLSYSIEGSIGKSFSALQVGFGLTFSLPIILAALKAKPGDLVIIENPEAHLHPSAQVKIGGLLSLLAANGVQVIIESHSDHILNSIRFAYREGVLKDDLVKIIFVRNIKTLEGNVPSVDYVDLLDKGKLSHRPSDFFDVWDKMLTKLL